MNFDIIPREALNMAGLLESRGFEAFFVGGCVRDILRGTRPNDWDIATNATPEQMKECFAGLRVIETGIKHGTLTVISDGLSFEVTTYRVDGKYEDNRRPTEVYFTRNLADDLSRRDFTINAMAYSPGRGLVDIFGGRKILKEDNPVCRKPQPALSRGRAADSARSALPRRSTWVEEDTASSIRETEVLKNISAERVRDNFSSIVGPGAERVLLLRCYMRFISNRRRQI